MKEYLIESEVTSDLVEPGVTCEENTEGIRYRPELVRGERILTLYFTLLVCLMELNLLIKSWM